MIHTFLASFWSFLHSARGGWVGHPIGPKPKIRLGFFNTLDLNFADRAAVVFIIISVVIKCRTKLLRRICRSALSERFDPSTS